MSALADVVQLGDRVRLHGEGFALGYADGVVTRVEHDIAHVRFSDRIEALVYVSLGQTRAVVSGVVFGVTRIESLSEAA